MYVALLDFQQLHPRRVAHARTSHVVCGGGCSDDIAIRHNRSFAGGTCPTVGLAGFLLGGGYGFYSRLWGMASDQLISATVVTWNASVVVANATSHPDLYWALRGGGNGNYGIVTSFTVKLHDPPGTAAVYTIEWPTNATSAAVIAAWQSWAPRLSPRMTSQLEVYGGGIVHSAGQLMGSPAELRRLLQPLSSIGSPNVTISEKSYQALVLDYAGCDNMTAVRVPVGAVCWLVRRADRGVVCGSVWRNVIGRRPRHRPSGKPKPHTCTTHSQVMALTRSCGMLHGRVCEVAVADA